MLIVGIGERPVNVEDGNGGVSHGRPLPAIPMPNRTVSELLCLVHRHVPERPGAAGGPLGHGLVVRGLTAAAQFPGVRQVGDACPASKPPAACTWPPARRSDRLPPAGYELDMGGYR